MSILLSYAEDKNDIWLGLKKKEVSLQSVVLCCNFPPQNTWQWTDGWPVLFTNWGSEANQSCAILDHYNDKWFSTDCQETHRFVCKWNNSPQPTTAPPGDCPGDDWQDIGGQFCYHFGRANEAVSRESAVTVSLFPPLRCLGLTRGPPAPLWLGQTEGALTCRVFTARPRRSSSPPQYSARPGRTSGWVWPGEGTAPSPGSTAPGWTTSSGLTGSLTVAGLMGRTAWSSTLSGGGSGTTLPARTTRESSAWQTNVNPLVLHLICSITSSCRAEDDIRGQQHH